MSITKSVIFSLLVVPAAALLFFGPRPGGDLPPNCVVVDYWEKWTGNEEEQMRQIVDAFNNTVGMRHVPRIFVRYVSTSDIVKKTLVATAAGVPPDISGLWPEDLTQFAAHDALMPLEEMAREKGITRSYYKPVYWDGCSYGGHLYGLVSTPGVVALIYNRGMFKANAAALRAAGLDPDRAPATIAELDAYSIVLTAYDGAGHIVHTGYLPSDPGWYLMYTPIWFGGDIWDEKTRKFTLTSPGCVAAYNWMQSYSKRLGKEAASQFQSGLGNFDSPQNPFLAQTVAMEQQGPWMANFIRRYDCKVDWAVAPFPSAAPRLENVSFCPFDALCIPRGAAHPKEAFEFIAFVNRQEVMEKLCTLHCKNSPLAKVSDGFIEHHPNPFIRVFEALASSPNAHAPPHIATLMQVQDELKVVSQRVILLDGDPAEELAKAQVKLQEQYDDFMDDQRRRNLETDVAATASEAPAQ